MSVATTTTGQPALAPLEWESNHFRFPVAQISKPDCSRAELELALQTARDRGLRLVVWPTTVETIIPDDLLQSFDGKLIDRKVTFARPLAAADARDATDHGRDTTNPSGDIKVVPYWERAVSASLAALAISSGAFSRFNIDPHFDHGKFESMYRIWIERSVRGELADVVLVAPLESRRDNATELGGMVTISCSNDQASIGLIAVASQMRGVGIGSRLLAAAHDWMRDRGVAQARVVTQLDNGPACRLYERAGYQVAGLQPYYHFWISGEKNRRVLTRAA